MSAYGYPVIQLKFKDMALAHSLEESYIYMYMCIYYVRSVRSPMYSVQCNLYKMSNLSFKGRSTLTVHTVRLPLSFCSSGTIHMTVM